LWQAINNAKQSLSNTKFKQHCLEHYWSIARVFEWRELFRQLLTQTKSLGWNSEPWEPLSLPEKGKKKVKPTNSFDARYENLHRAQQLKMSTVNIRLLAAAISIYSQARRRRSASPNGLCQPST